MYMYKSWAILNVQVNGSFLQIANAYPSNSTSGRTMMIWNWTTRPNQVDRQLPMCRFLGVTLWVGEYWMNGKDTVAQILVILIFLWFVKVNSSVSFMLLQICFCFYFLGVSTKLLTLLIDQNNVSRLGQSRQREDIMERRWFTFMFNANTFSPVFYCYCKT